MNSVLQRVYEIGIIPVIAFNSVDEALPLCKALMAGGLPAAEVTFRTACAEDCIKKIHEELPDMLLGAGTVLTKDQADRAMAAGASFIVAPGFDPEVCQHVIDKGGIMMPGTATAGEMQQAMNMGCEALKFFPAEANGGVGMLKNIGADGRITDRGVVVWKINVICTIVEVVCTLLALIPSASLQLLATVVTLVTAIAQIVGSILYILYLRDATTALKSIGGPAADVYVGPEL